MPQDARQGAREVATALWNWALTSGYVYQQAAQPTEEERGLREIAPQAEQAEAEATEGILSKRAVTGVVADDDRGIVTILTKGKLGPRVIKPALTEVDGVTIKYRGEAYISGALPPVIPPAERPIDRAYVHNERLACGSSITASTIPGAGTLGCLVRDQAGLLCGLTNNHVTGECNHMVDRMPVLAPAPMDATADGLLPFAVGRHLRSVPLRSGHPTFIRPQEIDGAIFEIIDETVVTSMQGNTVFDTPANIAAPQGGMRVKKVGRTSVMTQGTVMGVFVHPVAIPYKTHSDKFAAIVYFSHIFAVEGDGDLPFSSVGDSGSLVVSENGEHAVGLIFAGMKEISLMIPIQSVLDRMDLTLVSGYNV